MYKIAIIALLSIVSFANGGVVNPIIRCGGEGESLETRVTDCTSPPCQLFPNSRYTIEVDFIPARTSPELSFHMILILEGGTPIPALDVPIPGSAVEAGRLFNVAYTIIPEPTLGGRTFDIQVQLYNAVTGHIEICVRAPVYIVPPTHY